MPTLFSCKFERSPYISCRGFRISRNWKTLESLPRFLSFDLMTKILLSRRIALSSHSPFVRTILFKSIPFCGKILCLGIVVGEYPIIRDNLQSSTCLIWNRFVIFYTSPIFQMLRKDMTWLAYHTMASFQQTRWSSFQCKSRSL